MRNYIHQGLKVVLIILGLLTVIPAQAADEKVPPISPWLYKQLTKAEKLISSQAYPQARKKLEKIIPELKNKSYEQALALRSLASVYALENNYIRAAKLLEQCLATQTLPEQQQQQALLNLGQLYIASEQYQKAIKVLQPWVQKNPKSVDQQILVLLANAYTQLKQYRTALPYIEQAIKLSKKPRESWFQLNLALHYELGNYSAAARILKKLVANYPDKKAYWLQLATVYQQLSQFKQALIIQDLAYKKGYLQTETQILQLFNLYIYNKQPYQAANLLSKELDSQRVKKSSAHWELLANAWTNAREYKQAITALEKASALNKKGRLYLQLARIHVEQEHWHNAIKAINKALSKGELKNPGEAYILLGMSLYETKQLSAAKSAFQKARKYKKTRKSATQWLNYMENSNTQA
ncbi:tetratricopeptide repeat protein [methanotrophic endosymbiont of Bathymodiolus puteoserpentis (Logatchev)]|jgi:tetratricopeptide (TPR) repeat protein|uniref:tetratricopeptide repeat protein n=1 Tax=methanotrophic endosymbiont of Bathymodiolus puteoserpentis (Logatchev) TaxID=343235 RepID=UPI0013C78C00|nr:tetratricopeptide repeat protein [methanotrophic endosymbiont of Bathymodiolus puteoserpentis (Logatchev)]SHE20237.1 TPR domain protein, putative component of TonB system [methanotrophic endosymbiont of Bathymodiolus puteoserpentis (Logatchev)]